MEYLRAAKKELIEHLKNKGITDKNVLKAFDEVERHRFLESFLWPHAYEDSAIKLFCKQTISHPYTVAFQSQLLEVKQNDKIMEIGTGSGFQAAILSNMGAKVYSIERQLDLYRKAKHLLEVIDNRIFLFFGDGNKGLPKYAPFDGILVTCGAIEIPDVFYDQLKVGGKIVIPIGEDTQEMKRITKISEEEYKEEKFGDFIFVPMLDGTTNGDRIG